MPQEVLMYSVCKRILDTFFALVMLLLLSPLLCVVALLIRLESKGNALFLQTRVGQYEVPFEIFKFRTMVSNASEIGPVLTATNDPRITRLGQFLRRSSIDELPQLFNILKGEMSFIGPRPEVPSIVVSYTERQRGVFKVKPGISGWAQVNGRDDLDIPTKLNYDLDYVSRLSLAFDFKIFLLTFPALLSRRGVN
jgi:O-antigen biosynthesis protein WbqP